MAKDNSSNYRVALYSRVSSEQQTEAGTIQSQINELKEKIEADGHFLDSESCFVDDGYSGATLIRPPLERLRDVAYSGAIDLVYVHSPDRLARKYAYQVLLLEEFQRYGVEVIFLNHKRGQRAEEQLLTQVQGIIAEYERAKILERSRRGRLHAAKAGAVSVMSKAPYGYRYISRAEGAGEASYEIVAEEAKVVRQIFEWIGRDRLSLRDVCQRISNKGILTRGGTDVWSPTTISKMLRNPAYKGMAAYGKTYGKRQRTRLRPRGGGAAEQPRRIYWRQEAPKENWIYIAVPAIGPKDLFEIVQEQVAENRKRRRMRSEGAKYLLQGLLVCKKCGYAYYGKLSDKKVKNGKKITHAYYRCVGTNKHPFYGTRVCSNRPIRTDVLDEAVWRDVSSLLSDPRKIEEEYKRRLSDNGKVIGWDSGEHLEREIKKLKSGISWMIDAYAEGFVAKDEFESRIQRLRERLARLEKSKRIEANEEEQRKTLKVIQAV